MDYEIDKLITEFKNLVDQSCVSMKKHLDEKNAEKVFDICKDYLEKKKTSLLKSFDDDSNEKLIDSDHIFNNEEIDISQDDGGPDETYDIVDEVVRSFDGNHDIMNMSFYKVNVNDVNSSASIVIESDYDIDADNMHGKTYLIDIDEQSSVTCRRSFSMHDDSFTLQIGDNETDSRHVTFNETMLLYSYENEEEEKEEINDAKKKTETTNNENDENDLSLKESQRTTKSHKHDKGNANVLLIKNKKSNKTPKEKNTDVVKNKIDNKKSTPSKKNNNKIVKNIKEKQSKKSKTPEKTVVTRSASRERYDLRPRV